MQIFISVTGRLNALPYSKSRQEVGYQRKHSVIPKANLFLELSLFEMYKHFDCWANHLVFCGVASEKETARCVAQFLVEAILRQSIAEGTSAVTEQPSFWNEEPNEVLDVYTFEVHDRVINLAQF